MRISPLDIRNHPFQRRLSGYDREEVDAFLHMVADDYEALLREVERQREQLVRVEAQLEELTGQEKILQDTLITAQKLSEHVQSTAAREAEVLLGEAEVRAEKVLDAAHRRAAKLAEDIREMKSLRTRLAAAVRGVIETHLTLLDGLSEDAPDDPELEDKIGYRTRSPKEASFD